MTTWLDEYEPEIVEGLGTLLDAVLIGVYVAVVSIPAGAIVTGEVSFELALAMGIFAGLPQGLRYVLKKRGLLDHTDTGNDS